jgi:hypothetical protein
MDGFTSYFVTKKNKAHRFWIDFLIDYAASEMRAVRLMHKEQSNQMKTFKKTTFNRKWSRLFLYLPNTPKYQGGVT